MARYPNFIRLVVFILIVSGSCLRNSAAAESAITESIGSYTAGCIRNAAPLPASGEGFQVIRLGRGRYYANPAMIEYIESLAKTVSEQLEAILLIGDVAQRTGGPMYDEHSSHQIGLDADILFWQHPIALRRQLTLTERAHIYPQSVLNEDQTAIDGFKWDVKIEEIIKTAASDKRVDRIFVNPIIKRRLCQNHPGEKWLGKVRPWYGHDGHFHVRLKCPPGNMLCETQEPLNMFDDGCGSELDGWFRDDGRIRPQPRSGKTSHARLPDECIPILNGAY
ncbi:MAG: penicillin-insensitive murein endopeptidase [Thermodesulfobacteriota bacterium]